MKLRIKSKKESTKSPNRLKGPAAQYAGSTAVGALGTYGDLLSLLGFGSKEMTPGQEALINQEFESDPSQLAWLSDDDIAPRYGNLPSRENIRSNLESIIAPAETTSERFAQRAGEKLGGGLALPMSALAQLIGQGTSLASQGLQEFGGVSPEASQLIELGLDLGSGAIQNKFIPSDSQKSLYETAKKAGLSERELTPLLHPEETQRSLAKIGGRSEKTFNVIQEAKNKLGSFYSNIKDKGSNIVIPDDEKRELISSFEKIVDGFKDTLEASPDKKSIIGFIENSIDSLKNQDKNTSIGTLVNFWQDINNAVPWTAPGSFKKQLASLKEPLSDVIKKTNPVLGRDFQEANKLYESGARFSKLIQPRSFDGFLNHLQAIVPVVGNKFGTPIEAAASTGFPIIKYLGKAAQSNPRMQALGKKLVTSINNNKFEAASKIYNDLESRIKKEESKKEAKTRLILRKPKSSD